MIKAIQLRKIVFFVSLFLIIFGFLYYKNFLFGNNISKNRNGEKNEDMLSRMQNYYAEATVTVNSNKTQNSYEVIQEVKDDYSTQEVKSGGAMEGVKIELNGNYLKVSNAKLNLEKVYEDYGNLLNNSLFLNSFVADYKNEVNDASCREEKEQMMLEVKLNKNQNTYIQYKTLYIDAKTGKPTKLEIKDNTKTETICIIYNNIELKRS